MDLGSIGFYNQAILLNTLNEAMTKGQIGDYRVAQDDFQFRALNSKSAISISSLLTHLFLTIHTHTQSDVINDDRSILFFSRACSDYCFINALWF